MFNKQTNGMCLVLCSLVEQGNCRHQTLSLVPPPGEVNDKTSCLKFWPIDFIM